MTTASSAASITAALRASLSRTAASTRFRSVSLRRWASSARLRTTIACQLLVLPGELGGSLLYAALQRLVCLAQLFCAFESWSAVGIARAWGASLTSRAAVGRRRGGDTLDGTRQPIRRRPERQHLHDVGGTTGDDERPEAEEHPAERDVPSPASDEQRERNRRVRQRDQRVGHDVQPDQPRVPHVAVPMGHEAVGREQRCKKSGIVPLVNGHIKPGGSRAFPPSTREVVASSARHKTTSSFSATSVISSSLARPVSSGQSSPTNLARTILAASNTTPASAILPIYTSGGAATSVAQRSDEAQTRRQRSPPRSAFPVRRLAIATLDRNLPGAARLPLSRRRLAGE